MERITQLNRQIAVAAARLSGLLVVLMAILIGIDIVTRKLFSLPLLAGGVGELSGYALAVVSVWGAALTLLKRAHIRVDTLQLLLPRPLTLALDLLAAVSFTLAAGLLAWMGWLTFARSLRLDSQAMTPLATPLVIPQGIWFAGLVFLTVTSLWLTLSAIVLIARRDSAGARRLIGTRLIAEEIQENRAVAPTQGTPHA